MLDDNEAIWKALSDPSRCTVLHLLRNGPKTTGEIAKHFDQTRFAIMKHLSSLEVGCRLQVTHQAVGTIDQEVRERFVAGWLELLGNHLWRRVEEG